MMKKLYKRTTTGKVQEWWMEINPDDPSQYRTVSGQVDGKHVESKWKQAKPKNVGKVNETTGAQQAQAEVGARYTKQQKQNYHENVDNIDEVMFFAPMLAKKYMDYKATFNFVSNRYFTQPKLDGMRCLAKAEGLQSREGEDIVCVPHISRQLQEFFMIYPTKVLDGELYNHEYKDDFETIISNAKKTKPKPEDLIEAEKVIEFHLYDIIEITGDKSKFSERNELLNSLHNHFGDKIKIVETTEVFSHEDILKTYEENMDQGYEGQMIRVDDEYEHKKGTKLLKHKEFEDEEFELLDIEDGKGNYAGIAKRAKFKTKDGIEFRAGIKGKRERNIKLLKEKNQYIGTMCTVVFQGYTKYGKPRFGTVKEFDRRDNVKRN